MFSLQDDEPLQPLPDVPVQPAADNAPAADDSVQPPNLPQMDGSADGCCFTRSPTQSDAAAARRSSQPRGSGRRSRYLVKSSVLTVQQNHRNGNKE